MNSGSSSTTSDPGDIPESQTPSLGADALAEARSLIGVDLRRNRNAWNQTASPDAVRHFCWGIGDDNPLFCDPAHGANSCWQSALAPGCFLYTIDDTVVAPKLRGIQWLYAGTQWQWFRPIRHHDAFTVRARLIDAVEKQGSKARSFILQTGESIYTNQRGELVCRASGRTARTPRAKARDGLRYEPRSAHRYSAEELVEIAHALDAEELRSVLSRYWDEIEPGSWIRPMLKGPLNITDMICWYSGAGHSYQAHRLAHLHRKRHPSDAFINAQTGAQDSAARGHTEAAMAREVGMPGGYDVGPQRISWMGQLMTNWCGDDAFVRELDATIRKPNIFGDVSWCRAQIVDKFIQDDAYLVRLELRVDNQLGETTASGVAVVELPTRERPVTVLR
jgi:acyl dehydratase